MYDGAAGLYQNWHRDYDSATGRYAQSDPLGLAAGINTFSYVEANPISYTDPSGLQRGPTQRVNIRQQNQQVVRSYGSPYRPRPPGGDMLPSVPRSFQDQLWRLDLIEDAIDSARDRYNYSRDLQETIAASQWLDELERQLT